MLGKTLADLQSDISISAEHAVTGTLNWVENYTGFSSDPSEQSGNYIALKITTEASDEELEDATITATYHGRTVTLDSDQIIIVRHAEGEDTITFTASKEGYTTGVMTLDLSTLTFTPEPAKFSLVCNTPGVTFTPSGEMAGGMATFEITATGQVPYDTTTSSNLINMTLTTNASPDYDQDDDSILVAYVDSEEITHTLYTGSLTWSDDVGTATFNCPITADSITYSPVIAIVVDGTNATRVSQVLDTSALTLQDRPMFTINNTTTGLTLTPNNQMLGDNAVIDVSGTIPYNSTPAVSGYTNEIALTITTNDQDFQQGDFIRIPGSTPISTGTFDLTFNNNVGTKSIIISCRNPAASTNDYTTNSNYKIKITICRPGPDYPTTSSDYTVIATQVLQLTPYVISETPNINYIQIPSTLTYNDTPYSGTDFVTGGTILRNSWAGSNATVIRGAHFKWVNLNNTDSEYYLPFQLVDMAGVGNDTPIPDVGTYGGNVIVRLNNYSSNAIPSDSATRCFQGVLTPSGSIADIRLLPQMCRIQRDKVQNCYRDTVAFNYNRSNGSSSQLMNAIVLENCTFEEPPTA